MFLQYPLKVVVLDDDQSILDLYKVYLANNKEIEVNTFAKAAEALNFIKTTPNVHLTFIDINLDEEKGDQVLREIMEMRLGIDVVIATGEKNVINLLACFRGGARDYLLKPFKKEQLHQIIERSITSRQRWNDVLKDVVKKK